MTDGLGSGQTAALRKSRSRPADPRIALEKRLLKESKELAKQLTDNEAEMADSGSPAGGN